MTDARWSRLLRRPSLLGTLLADATEIQRLVSERHGIQRRALGWSESALVTELLTDYWALLGGAALAGVEPPALRSIGGFSKDDLANMAGAAVSALSTALLLFGLGGLLFLRQLVRVRVGILLCGLDVPLARFAVGRQPFRHRPHLLDAPHLTIFPGLAISLGVFGFNLFGDSLRDALDPRLRTQ